MFFSDASDVAVGGAILQESEGGLRPICFHSKILSPAEVNYCTSDREALGIFSILDANKSWLMGNRIKILSDHRALKFILTSMSDNPHLIRWRYLLQEFNPELYYLPGEQNLMADWYSRFAKATPGRTKMPMQDRFVAATEHTNLPRGVPETFNPPTIKMGINDMKDLLQLRGPLVVLSDTMSKVPLGPVGAMMDKIPSLKDYFAHRQSNGSTNFCTSETADTLGTYKKITGLQKFFYCFI